MDTTHILLVEPDAANAVIFTANASLFLNAEVTEVSSGVDAVAILETGLQPDVALIAWNVDTLHTLELLRTLREYLPQLPVVLTFERDEEPPPEVSSLNVQGIVHKPFLFPSLSNDLTNAMASMVAAPQEEVALEPETLISDPEATPPAILIPDVEATAEDPETLNSLAAMLDKEIDGPELGGHIELTPAHADQLANELKRFSEQLERLPILLVQDGTLISHEGDISRDSALAMARLAGRMWREGATRPAPEWLCFNDQIPGEGGERRAMALYSVLVVGDLALAMGWDGTVSLSTLRARGLEAANALATIFN
jgi:CheY-like chemotaxis protein